MSDMSVCVNVVHECVCVNVVHECVCECRT